MTDDFTAGDVRQVFERMADAWSRGDAAGYDRVFSDDVTVTDTAGAIVRGLADVSATHRRELAGPLAGSTMSTELVSVRRLAPGTVVAVARNRIEPHGRTVVFSAVMVRREGAWSIVSAQATVAREPGPEAA